MLYFAVIILRCFVNSRFSIPCTSSEGKGLLNGQHGTVWHTDMAHTEEQLAKELRHTHILKKKTSRCLKEIEFHYS